MAFCVQFDLLFSGLPARGLRSAGPDFLAIRNRGKNRQRRGLPPPCGIHPAVLGVPASIYCRPLSRWGHMDGGASLWAVPAPLWDSTSTDRALPWCAAVPSCRKPGSRRWQHRPTQVGPDVGTSRLLGPVAMQAWDERSDRSHSKGNGPNLDLTHGQPRTPGGYLGGNALGGFW